MTQEAFTELLGELAANYDVLMPSPEKVMSMANMCGMMDIPAVASKITARKEWDMLLPVLHEATLEMTEAEIRTTLLSFGEIYYQSVIESLLEDEETGQAVMNVLKHLVQVILNGPK